jgi:hypothetical protein
LIVNKTTTTTKTIIEVDVTELLLQSNAAVK